MTLGSVPDRLIGTARGTYDYGYGTNYCFPCLLTDTGLILIQVRICVCGDEGTGKSSLITYVMTAPRLCGKTSKLLTGPSSKMSS